MPLPQPGSTASALDRQLATYPGQLSKKPGGGSLFPPRKPEQDFSCISTRPQALTRFKHRARSHPSFVSGHRSWRRWPPGLPMSIKIDIAAAGDPPDEPPGGPRQGSELPNLQNRNNGGDDLNLKDHQGLECFSPRRTAEVVVENFLPEPRQSQARHRHESLRHVTSARLWHSNSTKAVRHRNGH